MTFLSRIWQGISGIVVGLMFMAYIALSYMRYWLHLGPKPTDEDFS